MTVPYVHSFTEKIQRTFTKHRVATVVKPQTTLRQVLVHLMDKVDQQKKAGVVYKIPRNHFEKVYIGETRKTAGKHRKRKRSLTEISQDPPIPMSTTKSAITDHVCQNHHIMNWEASEIVEPESDKLIRCIKESILCVRSNTPTMNRDEGACQLSPIWAQMISTPNQGRGRLQSDLARLS